MIANKTLVILYLVAIFMSRGLIKLSFYLNFFPPPFLVLFLIRSVRISHAVRKQDGAECAAAAVAATRLPPPPPFFPPSVE